MRHLLYLMFRCDFDVIESLKILEEVKTTSVEWSLEISRENDTARQGNDARKEVSLVISTAHH